MTQYQIQDWTDGSFPGDATLKNVTTFLNAFRDNIQNDRNPVVHCSAGIGRTGTFIAMHILREIINKEMPISIF